MHKKSGGETVDAAVCACASDVFVRFRCVSVRALQMCVRENFSHSARLLLQQSRASLMLALCLRAVPISSRDT